MTSRSPRLLDPGYIKWLNKRPCDACGKHPHDGGSNDAAHLKAGHILLCKPWAGTAKPDDKWATTLCRSCHTRQHAFGSELEWWQAHGIDPFNLCIRLYAEYGGDGGKARGPRPIKPRKPRSQRAKVPAGRKMQSRGFGK